MTVLPTKCSRVGCELEAKFLVEWRNPAIHQADRVKTWGACQEHAVYFQVYLESRGFYLGTRAFRASLNEGQK